MQSLLSASRGRCHVKAQLEREISFEFCLSLRCMSWLVWGLKRLNHIIICFCVYVFVRVSRSGIYLFSSPTMTRDQTQVIGLGCRCLYPLSCLVGLTSYINLSNLSMTGLQWTAKWKKKWCGVRLCVRCQASSVGADQFSRSPDHGPCLHKDPKKLPNSPKQPILSLSFPNWSPTPAERERQGKQMLTLTAVAFWVRAVSGPRLPVSALGSVTLFL